MVFCVFVSPPYDCTEIIYCKQDATRNSKIALRLRKVPHISTDHYAGREFGTFWGSSSAFKVMWSAVYDMVSTKSNLGVRCSLLHWPKQVTTVTTCTQNIQKRFLNLKQCVKVLLQVKYPHTPVFVGKTHDIRQCFPVAKTRHRIVKCHSMPVPWVFRWGGGLWAPVRWTLRFCVFFLMEIEEV